MMVYNLRSIGMSLMQNSGIITFNTEQETLLCFSRARTVKEMAQKLNDDKYIK